MWRYYYEKRPLSVSSVPKPAEAVKIHNYHEPRTLYWARTWDGRNKYIHVLGYVDYYKRLPLEEVYKYELLEWETSVR